ncbi:amino acid adenylation domain-containing protein [Tumebacillus lipolyticus]|uniref:Amino acid adenylation domain-containing protein n=1 Tax=Tumebacillus lipolyticus TaxID=1280370 RepID=A0ABW4ZX56_9BACL
MKSTTEQVSQAEQQNKGSAVEVYAFPASFSQQRLWFLDQLTPHNTIYNMPAALRLRGELDVAAFEQSFAEIVNRHESLRTTFSFQQDQLLQVVRSEQPFVLPIVDLQGLPEAVREQQAKDLAEAEAQHAFDLAQGPLLRARLLKLAAEDHVLILNMHHIISDGWSVMVLIQELAALYAAFRGGQPSPLPELPIQYADFAHYQREWMQGEVLEEQLDYWKRQLAGDLPVLQLPFDRSRPSEQTYRGATVTVELSSHVTQAVHEGSRNEGVTPFVLLLAAFDALLYRYTGQDEILVGSPVANRDLEEVDGLIGFFVNNIVLRANCADNPSFRELVQQMGKTAFDAYAHSEVPFERIVEELRPERNMSYSPLFQAMFVLETAPLSNLQLAGLTIDWLQVERGTAKNDLTLSLVEEDGQFKGQLEFNTDLFERATVERMARHFERLVQSAAERPELRLSELPLLTEEDLRLLDGWNRMAADHPADRCAHQLFEEQAASTPDAVALQADGEQWTYAELNGRANRAARYLRQLGVGPDVLVGLCMERSAELVIALLAVLKAGGAYVPIDPSYPEERVAFLLEDANAPLLLTQERLAQRLPQSKAQRVLFDAEWERIELESAENLACTATPDSLCYVIYTSGSTGTPKGTLIEHRGLVNYLLWSRAQYPVADGHGAPVHSSLAFDLTVTGLFLPLLSGKKVVLLPEEADVEALGDLLRTEGGFSLVKLTPAHLHLLEHQLAEHEAAGCTASFVIGGENLLAEHLQWWREHAPELRLFNEYGPTETVVGCCVYEVQAGDTLSGSIPIGRPIANTQLYVLDKHLNRVPIGAVGELYIGGAGVARGYLNRPELTAERFLANPFANEEHAGDGVADRLYKTGDLARYRADGTLEYRGRIDHQVKVRGYRIEPGEIEAALAAQAEVQEAVVVARGDTGDGQVLVAYVVAKPERVLSVADMRAALVSKLPSYMIPTFFVEMGALPLTHNGKVDLRALPKPDGTREVDNVFVAPRTETEQRVASMFSEVLGVAEVGVQDSFFDLGGHSLLATQLMSRIRNGFGVELPLRLLFAEASTVEKLAQQIERQVREASAGQGETAQIRPMPRAGKLPLSFAQQRLWFIDRFEPGSSLYNIPMGVRLRGTLQVAALRQALQEIVNRHEVLRTSFALVDGEPVQVIAPESVLLLPFADLRDIPEADREAQAMRLVLEEAGAPFDLEKGSLVRAKLLQLTEEEHILLVTIHHIAADGWSMGVLIQEFSALYTAFVQEQPSPLQPLSIQYADFAQWQRDWLQGEVLDQQLGYWKRQLGGDLPMLQLPTDRPRPAVQTFEGATLKFKLPPAVTDSLAAYSKQQGVTFYMTLLAAFNTLLYRYTGQEDLLVGSPIANRNRSEIEHLIGFFVNSLVHRNDLSGNPTFAELLNRVSQVTLDAYAHQDLPFERLVEEIQPERSLSYNPLFQVVFVLQNAPMDALALPGLELHAVEADNDANVDFTLFLNNTSKFDLTLYIVEEADGFVGRFEYNSDLFEATTIERMSGHYLTLLESIVDNPAQKIAELPMLTQLEQERMALWNDTDGEVSDELLHTLFDKQAAKTPERTAIVSVAGTMSYAELDRRANRVAHLLRDLGAQPNRLVAVAMEKGWEQVVAVLGILRAGAAYLPIDPTLPQDRIWHLLKQGEVEVVLNQSWVDERLAWPDHVQRLAVDGDQMASYADTPLTTVQGKRDIAYVIFTSGSTGLPKGVVIDHQGAVNTCLDINERFGVTEEDRVLALSSLSFDLSVYDLFGTLAVGGTVVIPDTSKQGDPAYWTELVEQERITIWNSAPALAKILVEHVRETGKSLSQSLRLVMMSGDWIPLTLPVHLKQLVPSIETYSLGGATEASIWSILYPIREIDPAWKSIPYGRPMKNQQFYILNDAFEPCPIGVAGDLYIGGIGLALGYWRDEEKTNASFITHPRTGLRLYRTGDQGRYMADGNIEFIGRVDNQVKVRGFRIELGEIEAVLDQHQSVLESVVLARPDARGDKQLVAYVVQQEAREVSVEQEEEQKQERLEQWELVFDETYSQPLLTDDPTLHIAGWNSTFDGEMIPADEMRIWVERTVERIQDLKPQRVLEIGCGTGMLLYRIAPDCEQYVGIDLSQKALAMIEAHLPRLGLANTVELVHGKAAESVELMETAAFDTVVINSVLQYFPSVDYLLQVIEEALRVLKPGGHLFLGDVRQYALLEVFHAAVQLHQAPDSMSKKELVQKWEASLVQEKELTLDPAFFEALMVEWPQITGVEVQLKRGYEDNELTGYRYDVVLTVGESENSSDLFPAKSIRAEQSAVSPTASASEADQPTGSTAPVAVAAQSQEEKVVHSIRWQEADRSVTDVREYLVEQAPQALLLQGILNERLTAHVQALEWLKRSEGPETVGAFRAQQAELMETHALTAVDGQMALHPEAFFTLEEELPYAVRIDWQRGAVDGSYNVLFTRLPQACTGDVSAEVREHSTASLTCWGEAELIPLSALHVGVGAERQPWNAYANEPLQSKQEARWIAQLRSHVKSKLPPYMVPSAFVVLDAFPITANGKIDRQALPEPELKRSELDRPYVAPRTELEKRVSAILADVLQIERVGVHDNFFELGGHSLLATQAVSRIATACQVQLQLRTFFEAPSVAGLAEHIAAEQQSGMQLPPLLPVARTEEQAQSMPLSFSQERLWFLDQFQPESSVYNISDAVRLSGRLHLAALEASVNAVVARHEALRTAFRVVDDKPVQAIAPQLNLQLTVIDLRGMQTDEQERETVRLAKEEAQTPFDLATGPLLRLTLLQLADAEHVLLLTMHHIISDGWSMGILIGELITGYEASLQDDRTAPAWPELAVQFADYALWQRDWMQGAALEEQLAYWRQQLGNNPPVLQLPTDRPRPAVQTYRGASERFVLSAELTAALNRISQAEGATLFMTLLSTFQTLLYRYSGQEDILVGTPIANRTRLEIESLIGFFVNTLVMRAQLSPEMSWRELLQQTRETALQAYAHQDLPFEKVVEELQPERSLSHSPLFQVMFVLQNAPMERMEATDLTLTPLAISDTATAKFDLLLSMTEMEHGLQGLLEYNTDLFNASTIGRLLNHFTSLLQGIAEDPTAKLVQLPLLTAAESEQLLKAWNDTDVTFADGELCVHKPVERQAALTPDEIAVICGEEQLTYRELNERANIAAHRLQALGVAPNTPVGLCTDRSLATVVGMLAILKAGGVYVALDPTYPADRLAFMLEDTDLAVLVTRPHLVDILPAHGAAIVALDEKGRLTSASDLSKAAESRQAENVTLAIDDAHTANPTSAVRPVDLCFILFTSGSTGRPKGVAMAHAPMTNLIAWQLAEWEFEPARTMQFASINFDASFHEIFSTLSSGGTLVIASDEVRRNSLALLRFLVEQAVERAFLPFVALHHLAEIGAQEEIVPTRLRQIMTAGEQLQITRHIVSWFQRMDGVTLSNQYGPTESHVVTFHTLTGDPSAWPALPPIGRPIANTKLYILDRAHQPVPIGVPGELFIGGVVLADGYYGRPELTAERFIQNPLSAEAATAPRLYRSGDSVRYLEDGSIEYLGRVDNQVKIRGFRVELGEVEAVLRQHPSVNIAAVIARDDVLKTKALVAYVQPEPGAHLEARELREYLQAKLPEFMVPAVYSLMEALPLSPNGKVDRRSLPAPDLSAELTEAHAAPRSAMEARLSAMFAEVLGREQVGIRDSFFELGGHSLLATQLISRLRSAFGVEVPLQALFHTPTVDMLAERIVELQAQPIGIEAPPIVPVARERVENCAQASEEEAAGESATTDVSAEKAPVSFAQQRLWFMDQLQANNHAYNMFSAQRICGRLDADVLKRCFQSIVSRHEALRTTFSQTDGQPYQMIRAELELPLSIIDLQHLSAQERTAEAHRLAVAEATQPFDLSEGPLIRTSLLRIGQEEHLLLLNMHHIVADGWSTDVLIRELLTLYAAYSEGVEPELLPLPIQYADFAAWQRSWLQGDVLDKQLSYWKQQLGGDLPTLQLPTDRPRPAMQSNRGSTQKFYVPQALSQDLLELSRKEGATLFMTLLAAFNTLLHRYAEQEDIIVGSPIAGRNREEIEGLIGFFINTLALRTDLSGNPSFRDLLKRVRGVTLGAYAHQDLPLEQLIEELDLERDLSRSNPLFQVMFVLQNVRLTELKAAGMQLEPYQVESDAAKFDLTLQMTETEAGMVGEFEYNTDLFDSATITRMIEHFQVLLAGIATDPDAEIGLLPILPAAERATLLGEWAATYRDFPQELLTHQLVEQHAAQTPEAVAVQDAEGNRITYGELNRRANRLAHRLQKLGVGPELTVGVCMERSIENLVALLGVLKAGGAYVPIDPSYPGDRIRYMLDNSDAVVLLAHDRTLDKLPEHSLPSLLLDEAEELLAAESDENLANTASPTNLAYIIYTSGSTGLPKGVQTEHRNLRNLVSWYHPQYDVQPDSRFTYLAGVAFDATIFEIWTCLTSGGCLHIPDEDTRLLPERLRDFLLERQITHCFLPTPLAEGILSVDWPQEARLQYLFSAGDRLRHYPAPGLPFALYNLYGPSEATVCTTSAPVAPFAEGAPQLPTIGRPVPNAEVYLLDKQMQPVPIGVPGEMYIGGISLARGYRNRDDLTAASFLPHPFQPGQRVYKTGDRARYLQDGQIEFLGRNDFQVKVRGFRIELGEIETVIAKHPGVKEALVIAAQDRDGGNRLIAYLVPEADQSALLIGELRSAIKAQLPDYMMPSAFVQLEAMPLTPNGKIDRKALPAPESFASERETPFLPPRNSTEMALVRLWEDLLNTSPIGVKDNFFDLGGHSLLAVKLMAEVEKRFGRDLPVSVLFQGGTIEHLSAVISEESNEPKSPIITMQPHGTRLPFFCIHAGTGGILQYMELARTLGADQPFYGIQAPGLEDESEPHAEIGAMAEHYLQEIKKIQPEGPYVLGGWCVGGAISFEIAKLLQQQGEEAVFVAIMDTNVPNAEAGEQELPDKLFAIEFAKMMLPHVDEQTEAMLEALAQLSLEECLGALLQHGKVAEIVPPDLTLPKFARMLNVFKKTKTAFDRYRPTPGSGTIAMFMAAEKSPSLPDATPYWLDLIEGGADVHEIPGDHNSMLEAPNVQVLADRLNLYLDPINERHLAAQED